jgi:hypothetical protein
MIIFITSKEIDWERRKKEIKNIGANSKMNQLVTLVKIDKFNKFI